MWCTGSISTSVYISAGRLRVKGIQRYFGLAEGLKAQSSMRMFLGWRTGSIYLREHRIKLPIAAASGQTDLSDLLLKERASMMKVSFMTRLLVWFYAEWILKSSEYDMVRGGVVNISWLDLILFSNIFITKIMLMVNIHWASKRLSLLLV